MTDPSRKYRWLLLLASLLTVLYLVAAAIRENYLAEWRVIQRDYRQILREKATDERGRELSGKFHEELKQTSVPALNVVDRCVSCHNGIDDPRMKDEPQPHRSHPGNILDTHPVDRFGCTVCHHGQGLATTFADAKAEDVFWDYPLLPAELTESTCASCHDAEKLPADQIPLLRAGAQLYRERSCGSCHKLGGRGGTLGPPLDNEGAKTKHQLTMAALRPPHTTWNWHQAHFRDPGGVVADSQMRNPTVTHREALALTAFVLSQWKRDIPESYLAPDKIEQKYQALHPTPLTGEQVYREYCQGCHGNGTYGRWDKLFKRFIPAIRGPGLQAAASRKYLDANIRQGRPGTQMPAWERRAGGLLPEEVDAVITYLKADSTDTGKPATLNTQGDATRGQGLFLKSCAGCHGIGGRGGIAPEIGNPVFRQSATDDFIVRTIKFGRIGTAMPAFRRVESPVLSDQDLADLLVFLRGLAPAPAATISQNQISSPAPGAHP